MIATKFTVLSKHADEVSKAMGAAVDQGVEADILTTILAQKLYTEVALGEFDSVEAAIAQWQQQQGSALAGDLFLSSEQRAWVYAGDGDFTEVTTKISGQQVPYPTVPVSIGPEEGQEKDQEEDKGPQCSGCGGYHGWSPKVASRTLTVGKIDQPRNVERAEMQALMQTAIGSMFTAENIPLNQDHARRAIRGMLRMGVRMLLEQGGGMSDAMNLMFEAIEKESKEIGKRVKARTLAVYSFEASPVEPPKSESSNN